MGGLIAFLAAALAPLLLKKAGGDTGIQSPCSHTQLPICPHMKHTCSILSCSHTIHTYAYKHALIRTHNARTHSCLLICHTHAYTHVCAHVHSPTRNHTHIHAAYIHTHADLHPLTCFTHGDACGSEDFLRSSLAHILIYIHIRVMSACVLQLARADVCEMLSEILPGTFLFGI